jgi:hypothetical protein
MTNEKENKMRVARQKKRNATNKMPQEKTRYHKN